MNDDNSPLVRQLRIAIRDSTPDRVLVNCEHLLATPGAKGPAARDVARLFGIDTAGSKVVHCTLHDYHVEGVDLDSAYADFKMKHCNACGDVKPRPAGWHYDDRARFVERVKYAGFVARFIGRQYGPRNSDED